MAEQIANERPKRRWLTILAGGYLILLYIALFVVISFFRHEQTAIRSAATPTATITPTHQLVVDQSIPNSVVLHDEFSSNEREWSLYFLYGKVEVISGKLILQSNIKNGFVIGTSNQLAPSGEKYYIQADFSTDIDQAFPYGLIFGLNRSLGAFYVFEIWPQGRGFNLLKYNAGKWHELVPFSRTVINSYPEANTLSVHFDAGQIELYINGGLVSTFSDNDLFRSTDVGVFAGNSGYRLIVDDFFVYTEK